uniref:Uncharacterized protein n=1 Tax=uncultured Microgenomates bacterium Rifle_16ft_4_minimus_37836 TaxID=1665115 RepID=A0A0H4TQ81_9BACT|nr:hypothetical protein [uncultured Microgenomates bacterium Rifle_16ft_4_minimus_37836]
MNYLTVSKNYGKIFSNLVLLILLVLPSYLLIFRKIPYIPILDDVNLLIHEAGHVVFNPFGEFISFLGGSLMQLIIPGLFLTYFLMREDSFAVFFCLFWIGENLINISYYLADARNQVLPLVGGGRHDWTYMLSKVNLLNRAKFLGEIVFWIGGILLILSLVFTTLNLILSLVNYFKPKGVG